VPHLPLRLQRLSLNLQLKFHRRLRQELSLVPRPPHRLLLRHRLWLLLGLLAVCLLLLRRPHLRHLLRP